MLTSFIRCRLAASLLVLLASGCASQPALPLLEHMPAPPADAPAAEARCDKRQDAALDGAVTELSQLQKQEEVQIAQASATVKAAPDAAADYSKAHPQVAQALVDHQGSINDEHQALNADMDRRARPAVDTLNHTLEKIDAVERHGLNLCLVVLQDNHWVPKPDCADPVRAQAHAARLAAADQFLASAQGIWRDWKSAAERSSADWLALPANTPDPGDPYVLLAQNGYRHSLILLQEQMITAHSNLCSIAVQAVNRPDSTP